MVTPVTVVFDVVAVVVVVVSSAAVGAVVEISANVGMLLLFFCVGVGAVCVGVGGRCCLLEASRANGFMIGNPVSRAILNPRQINEWMAIDCYLS